CRYLVRVTAAEDFGADAGEAGELTAVEAVRRTGGPAGVAECVGEALPAERVSAGGGSGGGGIWSVRRDRPPSSWVAEGAPRWWTVVLVNWEDDPRDVAVPLAALGISGARFAAYDVWREAPLADPKASWGGALEARPALV